MGGGDRIAAARASRPDELRDRADLSWLGLSTILSSRLEQLTLLVGVERVEHGALREHGVDDLLAQVDALLGDHQPLDPPVVGVGLPLDEAEVFEPVDQRGEVRRVEVEALGELRMDSGSRSAYSARTCATDMSQSAALRAESCFMRCITPKMVAVSARARSSRASTGIAMAPQHSCRR